MKAKLFSRKRLGLWLGLALILLVILTLLISRGYSKYRTQVAVANEVNYVNQLASGFTLTDSEPSANILVPGTTITWQPQIIVTGKTEIPAYLYVEIVESPDSPFALELADGWLPTACVGRNNGTVYAYNGVLTGQESEPTTFDVLKNNTISVPTVPVSEGETICCYAYLIQKTDDADAATTFTNALSEATSQPAPSVEP